MIFHIELRQSFVFFCLFSPVPKIGKKDLERLKGQKRSRVFGVIL